MQYYSVSIIFTLAWEFIFRREKWELLLTAETLQPCNVVENRKRKFLFRRHVAKARFYLLIYEKKPIKLSFADYEAKSFHLDETPPFCKTLVWCAFRKVIFYCDWFDWDNLNKEYIVNPKNMTRPMRYHSLLNGNSVKSIKHELNIIANRLNSKWNNITR